jgi:hypothetical protein
MGIGELCQACLLCASYKAAGDTFVVWAGVDGVGAV